MFVRAESIDEAMTKAEKKTTLRPLSIEHIAAERIALWRSLAP